MQHTDFAVMEEEDYPLDSPSLQRSAHFPKIAAERFAQGHPDRPAVLHLGEMGADLMPVGLGERPQPIEDGLAPRGGSEKKRIGFFQAARGRSGSSLVCTNCDTVRPHRRQPRCAIFRLG
jgi:hypothetical protein